MTLDFVCVSDMKSSTVLLSWQKGNSVSELLSVCLKGQTAEWKHQQFNIHLEPPDLHRHTHTHTRHSSQWPVGSSITGPVITCKLQPRAAPEQPPRHTHTHTTQHTKNIHTNYELLISQKPAAAGVQTVCVCVCWSHFQCPAAALIYLRVEANANRSYMLFIFRFEWRLVCACLQPVRVGTVSAVVLFS